MQNLAAAGAGEQPQLPFAGPAPQVLQHWRWVGGGQPLGLGHASLLLPSSRSQSTEEADASVMPFCLSRSPRQAADRASGPFWSAGRSRPSTVLEMSPAMGRPRPQGVSPTLTAAILCKGG